VHARGGATHVGQTERFLTLSAAGLLTVLLLGLAVTNAAPTSRGSDRAAAATMVTMVNTERALHDLAPLRPADDVTLIAEAWSERMAANGSMEHNPDHPEQICCWRGVAENVAFAEPYRLWRPGDRVLRLVEELHEALLASPGHRANLLDGELDEIGIGVHVHTDGSIWITQNFRRSSG
jgi:uncharacterized protein YkwD